MINHAGPEPRIRTLNDRWAIMLAAVGVLVGLAALTLAVLPVHTSVPASSVATASGAPPANPGALTVNCGSVAAGNRMESWLWHLHPDTNAETDAQLQADITLSGACLRARTHRRWQAWPTAILAGLLIVGGASIAVNRRYQHLLVHA